MNFIKVKAEKPCNTSVVFFIFLMLLTFPSSHKRTWLTTEEDDRGRMDNRVAQIVHIITFQRSTKGILGKKKMKTGKKQ